MSNGADAGGEDGGLSTRHAAADGSFVGKTWLSGYEPTRVVLSQHKLFWALPCRICGGRVGRWRCCTLRWCLAALFRASRPVGLIRGEPVSKTRRGSQGLRFFINLISVLALCVLFVALVFLRTVDELTWFFASREGVY